MDPPRLSEVEIVVLREDQVDIIAERVVELFRRTMIRRTMNETEVLASVARKIILGSDARILIDSTIEGWTPEEINLMKRVLDEDHPEDVSAPRGS